MGTIFMFVGVWLVVSGVKDIRASLGINDICETESSIHCDAVCIEEPAQEETAVA